MEHNITVNLYAPGLIATRMITSDADENFGGEMGSAFAFSGLDAFLANPIISKNRTERAYYVQMSARKFRM